MGERDLASGTPPLYVGLRGSAMKSFRFQPRCEPVSGEAGELTLAEVLARLAGEIEAPVLLDSAVRAGSRVSLLAFDPLPLAPPRSLRGLRRFVARLEPRPGDELPGSFHGGFCGALAYELGASAERGLVLPPDPWGFPVLIGGLYCDFFVRDELRGETWLVLGEEPRDARASVTERARRLRQRLARRAPRRSCEPAGPLVRLVPRAEHCARIERARALIAEGEIYQANLSHRFERLLRGDPLALYPRLRALHPAAYMGFARWKGGALLSASPELLLEWSADQDGPLARTRPIKGTIARGANAAEDRRNAARLLSSEKDRAELAMIVDLERNDLGRIARAGTVRVEGFPRLASLPTVHHLVADVCARPREGIDAVDCLAAIFPGGSVTGAPKLRSMEVIAALEGEGRGFAYGSLACLDTRGWLSANLLIRTLIWRPREDLGPGLGQVSYRVGGGITWGSRPAAEDDESLAKGAALARALEAFPRRPRSSRGWRSREADALL